MFSLATKEALKVGLAIFLTILCAFWLGWDRAYWSAIAVFIVAINESYSHSIAKARNRLIGTLIGVLLAILLLAMFPQDRLLFIAYLSVVLIICVLMDSHKRYGYIFKMAYMICVMIACIGGLDNDTTFAMAVLRIQETLLGIIVYSVVFRFVWPRTTQDYFFEQFAIAEKSIYTQLQKLNDGQVPSIEVLEKEHRVQLLNLHKLNEILHLPLSDSPKLCYQKKYWRALVDAYIALEHLMGKSLKGDDLDRPLLIEAQHLFSAEAHYTKAQIPALTAWTQKVYDAHLSHVTPLGDYQLPVKQRIKNAIKAESVLLTCLGLWIYLPVPGGYIMPLLGAILAGTLASFPNSAVKYMGYQIVFWSVIFILQFVFIMPALTEAWQIAGLYFINTVVIWKLSEKPTQQVQKLLAGNMSVVLGMGALQLTPNYSIITSLMMLLFMIIVLAIIHFFNRVYNQA